MIGIVGYGITFLVLLGAFLLLPALGKKSNVKKQGKKPFLSGVRLFGVVLLCVALFFEVFVANFQSFHVLFGNYEETEVNLTADNVKITGTSADTPLTSGNKGEKMVIEMTNIGRPVGTLHLVLEMPEAQGKNFGTPYVDVTVDAKDVTQAATYRSSVANGQIIRGNERTQYITLDLSGNVEALRVSLKAAKDQTFVFKSMTFNQSVPMQFSVIRLLAIVGIVAAIYGLIKCPAMLANYGDRKNALCICVFAMTVIMMFTALATTFLYNYERSGELFLGDSGNQMTKELVDAFEAGQVHLLDTPSQELLEMENPYDWSARRAQGVSAKWDHLLFEGKYYSYYGIAPVLLVFLPYHVVTGEYFNSATAVYLFGALGIMFLSLLFLEFCEKFGKKLPNNILLCTLFVMQMSSGVWYNFMSPLFYEIAQSSGFLCICAGFYFLLKSNVIGDGVIKYRHIVFSTLFLSLAVLCRPTLAVYCITALAFLAWGFVKNRKANMTMSRQTQKKSTIQYLVASLACFVLIGGVQMWYNYARFGNILDFGIQYSLTINDFTRSQYHTDFAMIGFYNFLFAFPIIKPEFPFIFSNYSTLDVNGYYFTANRNAVGLFIRALPTLGLAGSFAAFKHLDKKEKWQALSILLPTCVIAPLVIIFSIWESGYGVRYCCDFAWQIILGGAAVLFFLYAKCAESQTKKILQGFFVVSAVVALVMNGAMLYDYINKGNYLTTAFMSFERLFDFWI